MSVRDKILLQLKAHPMLEDRPAPQECTQGGLSEATGASQTYLAQQLYILQLEGMVEGRTCRIRGGKRRVMAYRLTEKGRSALSMLR